MYENQNIANFENASGKIRFRLTNDIIFHAVMQESETSLKSLVGSLLGLTVSSIIKIEIINPINIKGANYKETIMDLKVLLDDSEIINVELQMHIPSETLWWTNRTILYLCRAFDNIGSGDDYLQIKPATQISIVDDIFLENEVPQFYSKYMLMNTVSHKIYASNFALNVLYLKQSKLATADDVAFGLVDWANMFNATTWDELKSIASNNPILKEVAQTMYIANADPETCALAEAQEKYARTVLTLNNLVKSKDAAMAEAEEKYERTVLTLNNLVKSKDVAMAEAEEKYERTVLTLNNLVKSKEAAMAEKTHTIDTLNEIVNQKDSELAELQDRVKRLEKQLGEKK